MTDIATNEPNENLGAIPLPEGESAEPLHVRFTTRRNRLLALEKLKANGGEIDLREVQTLVRECADLMAQIQVSTTGPKKKAEPGEKAAKGKAAKPKKASSIAHLNIPEGDDF